MELAGRRRIGPGFIHLTWIGVSRLLPWKGQDSMLIVLASLASGQERSQMVLQGWARICDRWTVCREAGAQAELSHRHNWPVIRHCPFPGCPSVEQHQDHSCTCLVTSFPGGEEELYDRTGLYLLPCHPPEPGPEVQSSHQEKWL